jgi:hypothetical protein
METTINMHKPEVKWLNANERHFNYTLGGIAHYRAEIAILTENGYTSTEHDVPDRDGVAMTVAVLYRNGVAVKAYEL